MIQDEWLQLREGQDMIHEQSCFILESHVGGFKLSDAALVRIQLSAP